MEETAKELHYVLGDDLLKSVIVLIFSNKSDLKNSLPLEELTKTLELEKIKQKWKIQSCCALTGEGIKGGLKWLSDNL
jgi:signal recognition particle receptor subunit beta